MQRRDKMLEYKQEIFSAKTHHKCSNWLILPHIEHKYLKVHYKVLSTFIKVFLNLDDQEYAAEGYQHVK